MRPLTTQSLEWIETAPAQGVSVRHLPATPDEVFAVLADHEGWATWGGPITKVVVLGPAEGVGARRRVEIGPVKVDEEFLAWEPGARFGFTVTHSSGPGIKSMCEDIQLAADGDGTRIRYAIGLHPIGPKLVARAMSKGLDKTTEQLLSGLASHLDGR